MKHNIHNLIKVYFIVPLILFSLFITTNTRTQHIEIERAKVVDLKQLSCLATNIYYEAGKETTEGKAAVARVVMNRINHGFANTPCKVIYQTTYNKQTEVKTCQFSWVCEGKGKPNERDPRYQNALHVAYNVLAYDMYREVIPTTVLFFHNLSVQPNWPYQFAKQIGNHIFYSKPPRKKSK